MKTKITGTFKDGKTFEILRTENDVLLAVEDMAQNSICRTLDNYGKLEANLLLGKLVRKALDMGNGKITIEGSLDP